MAIEVTESPTGTGTVLGDEAGRTMNMRASRSRIWVPGLVITFFLVMALASRGFLEADETTHYLYSQSVWEKWPVIVSIWARLGVTALFALGAPAGIVGAQVVAALVTTLTGFGTWKLLKFFLKQQGTGNATAESFFRRHAQAFAWLLLIAQPCVVLYGFTVMTEMPLACTWVWAIVAVCHRRYLVAGLLFGVGGLMRPEGWIAIASWPWFYTLLWILWERKIEHPRVTAARGVLTLAVSTLLAGLPVLGWYLLGYYARDNPRWFIDEWPWQPKSQYGTTGLMFVVASLTCMVIWMWLPVIAGAWHTWTQRRRAPVMLLTLVLPPLGFFLLHGTLGIAGLFGSMSMPRYFIAVSPMLAVLAFFGLVQMESWHPRTIRALAVTGCVAPVLILVCLGYLPMRPLLEQKRLDVAIDAVEAMGVSKDAIIAEHPYVMLRMKIDPEAPTYGRIFHPEQIQKAPPGTVVISDSMLWVYEHRPSTDELRAWGYVEDLASAARIDAVGGSYEAFTIKPPDPVMRVRVWVKQ